MAVRTKHVLLTAAGLSVVLLAFFTAPMLWQLHTEWKDVERVFAAYTADLEQERFDEAYEFCGPDFRSQSSRMEFVDQQRQLQRSFGRLRSAKVKGMRVTQTGKPAFWTARISADLEYENASRHFEFSFRKQNGGWLLYGYEEAGPSKAASTTPV